MATDLRLPSRREPIRVTLRATGMPLPSQKPAAHRTMAPQQLSGSTRAQPLPALPAVMQRRSMTRVMWHVDELPAALADRLWSDPDEVLSRGHMLKDGDRCTVVRITSDSMSADTSRDSADGSCTLKRYNLKALLHTAIHMPLRSRARWSWLNGRRLIKAGLSTPMPLACIEERRHGVLHLRSYLLTTFVPGRSLLDAIQSGEVEATELASLAKQFSRIWQTLGQLRAGHGDMKATNFIVDLQGKLWLVDLDGLRIHRSGILLRRERRNDLVRFMRNWQDRPEVAAVFRARIGTG